MNQIVLVGRLVADPEVKGLEEKSVSNITIAIPRLYKNSDGEYDTDFVDCELWNSIANNTAEYCKKGDIVGVKGRIKTELYHKEDDSTVKVTKIIAEKVTFLSSKKNQ